MRSFLPTPTSRATAFTPRTVRADGLMIPDLLRSILTLGLGVWATAPH